MIVNLKEKDDLPFEWIDISNPARRELREVAEKHRLHRALVEDSLQPEHFSVFFMPLTFIVGIYPLPLSWEFMG